MKKIFCLSVVMLSIGCAPAVSVAQELILGNPSLRYDYPVQASNSGDQLLAMIDDCYTIFSLESNKVIYKNCQDKNALFDSSLSRIYSAGTIQDRNGIQIGKYDPSANIIDDQIINQKMEIPLDDGNFETVYLKRINIWQNKKIVFASSSEGLFSYEYDGELRRIARFSGIFIDAIDDRVLILDPSGQAVICDISGRILDSFKVLDDDSIRIGGFAKFVSKDEVVYFGNVGDADLSIKTIDLNTEKVKNTKLSQELRVSLYDSRLFFSGFTRMPDFSEVVMVPSRRTLFVKQGQTIKF